MADLRTLAQAVVEAWEARHQGRERPTDVQDAYDILAALDAADAQGYARAMGEVDAHAKAEATGACPGDDAHCALHDFAEWARERAAAAERD